MPRPKKQDSPMLMWDARVTPVDGQPIQFHPETLDFEIFLACREGGDDTDKKLHYHIYMVSRRSETWLRQYLACLGGATATVKGNSVYSLRKAHEGTIGYVIKEGNVVSRHGLTDTFLSEMITKSKQYRKDLESDRKRVQRSKENTLAEILKVVAEGVKNDPSPTPQFLVQSILDACTEKQIRFPSRSTIENAVMTILYKTDQSSVLNYYCRNLYQNNFS